MCRPYPDDRRVGPSTANVAAVRRGDPAREAAVPRGPAIAGPGRPPGAPEGDASRYRAVRCQGVVPGMCRPHPDDRRVGPPTANVAAVRMGDPAREAAASRGPAIAGPGRPPGAPEGDASRYRAVRCQGVVPGMCRPYSGDGGCGGVGWWALRAGVAAESALSAGSAIPLNGAEWSGRDARGPREA